MSQIHLKANAWVPSYVSWLSISGSEAQSLHLLTLARWLWCTAECEAQCVGGSQRCLCLKTTLGGFVNWQYLAHHSLINQNFGDGPAIIVCLKLLNDSNMQSGLRATASDAFFFHSSPLTVYSLSYIQQTVDPRKEPERNKENKTYKCQSLWES